MDSTPSSAYKSPVKHKMTRRASFHDYTMPGIYMFTLQKHPDAPVLSHVFGNPAVRSGDDAPRVALSSLGRILDEELQKMADAYQMEIDKLKEFMGDSEKTQIKADIAVQEAVTLLVEAAVEE